MHHRLVDKNKNRLAVFSQVANDLYTIRFVYLNCFFVSVERMKVCEGKRERMKKKENTILNRNAFHGTCATLVCQHKHNRNEFQKYTINEMKIFVGKFYLKHRL